MPKISNEKTPLLSAEAESPALQRAVAAPVSVARPQFFTKLPTELVSGISSFLPPAAHLNLAQASQVMTADLNKQTLRLRAQAALMRSLRFDQLQEFGISSAVINELKELKGSDDKELIASATILLKRLKLITEFHCQSGSLTLLEVPDLSAIDLCYLAGESERVPLERVTNPISLQHVLMKALSGKGDCLAGTSFFDLKLDARDLRTLLTACLLGGNFENFKMLVPHLRPQLLDDRERRVWSLEFWQGLWAGIKVAGIVSLVASYAALFITVAAITASGGVVSIGFVMASVLGVKLFIPLLALVFPITFFSVAAARKAILSLGVGCSDGERGLRWMLNIDRGLLLAAALGANSDLFQTIKDKVIFPFHARTNRWGILLPFTWLFPRFSLEPSKEASLLRCAALGGNKAIFQQTLAALPSFYLGSAVERFCYSRVPLLEAKDSLGRSLANCAVEGGNAEIAAQVKKLGVKHVNLIDRAGPSATQALDQAAAAAAPFALILPPGPPRVVNINQEDGVQLRVDVAEGPDQVVRRLAF